MKHLLLFVARAATFGAVSGVVFFALVFLLAPDWLQLRRPVVLNTPTPVTRTDSVSSYSSGALRAIPSVVSVYAAPPAPSQVALQPSLAFRWAGGRRRWRTWFGRGDERRWLRADEQSCRPGRGCRCSGSGQGQPARARVVGTDPETDLAVLKIEAEGLQPIAVGDSDGAQVGDVVLAIGNPFGVGQTVTPGIVSGTGRNRVGINTFENFIQTDAAINPGNSGGALVDAAGRLIGINTAILSPSGGSLGIGFAIPVRTATEVMTQLVQNGRVDRGWLGVEARTMTQELARGLGVDDRPGAVIVRLLRGGPADAAGMEPGDVVVAVDGKPVTDTVDLINRTAVIKPGENGRYTVLRGRDEVELTVKTARRPPIEQAGRR